MPRDARVRTRSRRWLGAIAVGLATVGASAWLWHGRAADGPLRVEVSSDGFSPWSLVLPSTGVTRVLFRRTSDEACAHAVVFPALNLERALPLHTDVPVDVPPDFPRRLGFQCGAGKYRGKLIVD